MRTFVQWLLVLCVLGGAAFAEDDSSSDSSATSASTAVGSAGGNSAWR